MNLDETLREELLTVTRTLDTPAPPAIADLVARAGRETRRTRRNLVVVSGLVAAAVVGAVLLGSSIGKPDAGPSPSQTPSPSYYAPGVPYVVGSKLFIAHQQQPGEFTQVYNAGPYTLAWRLDYEHGALALRNGQPLGTADDMVTRFSPVLSSGGTVAWLAEDHGKAVIITRNLSTGKDLGKLATGKPIDSADGGNNFQLDAVRDDGTVYYQVNDAAGDFHAWTWKPGSAPRRGEPDGVTGTPDPTGFPTGIQARLSPDGLWGAWFTGNASHGTVVVQKPRDPSSRFTLTLPHGADMMLISWTSPTVFSTASIGSDVPDQTCDITTRTCTVKPPRT